MIRHSESCIQHEVQKNSHISLHFGGCFLLLLLFNFFLIIHLILFDGRKKKISLEKWKGKELLCLIISPFK